MPARQGSSPPIERLEGAGPVFQDAIAELTPRERQILIALLDGRRTPRIAEELHLSTHTVRNHRKAIYRKLGVHSQLELMARAQGAPGPGAETRATPPTR